jgi:hypothetical protein
MISAIGLSDVDRCKNESLLFLYRLPVKGTVSRDFLRLVFFMNQFPPQPQSMPLGPFRIFSKIRGDIRKSRCTTRSRKSRDTVPLNVVGSQPAPGSSLP